MTGSLRWDMTPRQSVERAGEEFGWPTVIAGCRALVREEPVDPRLVRALGGPAAEKFLDGRPHEDTYWLRVWGLRGLLWVWDESAVPAVTMALIDDAWRVREMAFKVIARHRVGGFEAETQAGAGDPVGRVRRAADRASAEARTHEA